MNTDSLRLIVSGFGALAALCVPLRLCHSAEHRDPGAIAALAFSPDGKGLAVGLYGQVVIYDPATWQPIARTTSVEDTVRSIAFRESANVLAIGSGLPGRAGRLSVWDRNSNGAPLMTARGADTIAAIAWQSDAALVLGGDDKKAYLISFPPAPQDKTLEDHNDRVSCVAISPKGGTVFATGGADKMVKVWDARTRKAVINFDQSEAGVTGLAFLPNGTTLVGSSLDGRLYWWNVSYNAGQDRYAGNRVRVQDAHAGGVNAMALSANGQRLITGGEDRLVRVWDPANGRALRTLSELPHPVYAVAISPDGKTAAAGGRGGRVYVWSADDGRLVAVVRPAGLAVVTGEPPVTKVRAR